ncbi:uncharacterized protein LOC112494790 isoform X2 [Cephus cinctus]|uniref:Uncharacterized protein LOC112494790 isoform X2 n=1 Tax=Cephus cinctus TaxID=211228 RepID=A0AAJ7W4M2_CEPCN|nr:uncharacterized protein LOC112494790 isoform X2 [Cephus cinctus]
MNQVTNNVTSKLPEIKETAVNEQDQSIWIVQNDNERKSVEKQNKFEPIKSSQRISLENNTDLKKSIYNDASTQYEESTITAGDTKLSDTSGNTLELNDKVYLQCKTIADVIKTLDTLSESQYSTEVKRKSKFYECSRKYGYSKRNEKALRYAMARYIKKIVLSETRHKNKLKNEVKIIIGDNNSKANKIKVMNERPGEVSIICYNVMESVLPIKKKNIVLPRWAESSAGESSGYKSLNNYQPDINGTRTSLELLHKKNMEHDENRVNVKAEVENVKCSSEEDQRNFGAINTSRDFTSKKCSSDMDAQFFNEHTKQRKEAGYFIIPVTHARDQCTAEFSNETKQIKRETIAICKNHTFLNAKHDSNMKCDNDQIAKHNVHPWLRKYIHTPNLQYSVQNDGLLTARKEKESTKEENRCLDALYALWTNMRDGVNSTDDESISSKNSKTPDIPSNNILAQLPRPPVSFLTKFPSFENTDFDFTDGDVSVLNEDISRVESTVTTEISILSGTGLSHTDQQTNDFADNFPNQKLCHVSNNTSIYPPPPSFLPIPYSLCCVPKRRGNDSFNDYKEPPPACSVPVPETWKEPSAIKSHSTSFSILRFRKRGKSVNLENSVEINVNDPCRLNRLTKNETKTKKTSRNPFRIFFRRKEDEIDDTNR